MKFKELGLCFFKSIWQGVELQIIAFEDDKNVVLLRRYVDLDFATE